MIDLLDVWPLNAAQEAANKNLLCCGFKVSIHAAQEMLYAPEFVKLPLLKRSRSFLFVDKKRRTKIKKHEEREILV